ncbi:MAG TPA: FAD-binding oxidoreductase [Solirubrobacterales bacterium]|nr:FAD-binding oxidoreductase [Solirubrobacterales bacterium]
MHDVAIIGGGVLGLFAAAAAAARDLDVVCLEAGEPLAGQSRGEGRIFRTAHEQPELCELALRAAPRWAECERSAGAPLLDRCGLAVLGETAEARHAAMRASGAESALAGFGELGDRLPQMRRDDDVPMLWDPAGASIRTAVLGRWLRGLLAGRLRTAAPVRAATRVASGWSLDTPGGPVAARAVGACAGTDAPAVAAMLGVELPDWAGVQRTLRLTFARSDTRPAPCVIDRAGEAGSYSLPTADGYSVGIVGSEFEPEVGGIDDEQFREHSAAACRRYARERLVGVGPEIVAEVTCEVPVSPLLADDGGWSIVGDGDAVVLVALNAYKFAPLIGDDLIAALGH